MDHPAVKLWRDKFQLNLSKSWKADVEKTVTDLKLWKSILDGWHYWKDGKKFTKHPGIKGLLTEYERLATPNEDAPKHNGAQPVSDSDRPWLSERRESNVSQVQRNPERLYFGVDRLV